MPTDYPFDSPPEERATVRAFITPPPIRDADLKGKTAIVTGSNAGIGFECAHQLLDLGISKLILAVRNDAKGQRVKAKLLSDRQLQDDAIKLAKQAYPSIAIITLPNPGLIYGTNLGRFPGWNPGDYIGNVVKYTFRRSATLGIRTIIAGAVKFGSDAHGQYIEDGKLEPLAPFTYTSEGNHVAKFLWNEAMGELSFAGVESILDELRASS
ncbi:hypothetical protein Hte_005796 [Hypoxylon texense]